MEAYKFTYLIILLISVAVNSQYNFQQNPNVYPWFQNVPYYNDVQQQQILSQPQPQAWPQQLSLRQQQDPYYGQQQFYYLVNQPVYYPANSQPVYNPYPYQYGGGYQTQPQPQQQRKLPEISKNQTQEKAATPDPYAGVETEYIDVKPEEFRRIIQSLRVEPTIISYDNRAVKRRTPKFSYVVSSEQSNNTNAPIPIKKYQSTSKIYTFHKTFVLHPGDNTSSVVNLTFVNGEQVTDSPNPEASTPNGTTPVPNKIPKRFIDVPAGCEDGLRYSATGGCFTPFTLHLDDNTENSTTTNTSTFPAKRGRVYTGGQ